MCVFAVMVCVFVLICMYFVCILVEACFGGGDKGFQNFWSIAETNSVL